MQSLPVLRPGATSRRRRGIPTAKQGCTCEPSILLHGFRERTSPGALGRPQGAAPPHGEPRAAGGRSGADSFRGVKPRQPRLTGSAAAGSHGYPPDGTERSVSTESCRTPRLPRTRVRVQFRDVWPRPLEPETPETEIWGSRACGEDDLWRLRLLGGGSPLGSWNIQRLVPVILPGPAPGSGCLCKHHLPTPARPHSIPVNEKFAPSSPLPSSPGLL